MFMYIFTSIDDNNYIYNYGGISVINKIKAAACAAVIMLSLFFILGAKGGSVSDIVIETVVLSPGNTAPIAENIEISTYRGTVVSGEFKAVDAEKESITFHVVKQPKYGTVTVNGDGTFVYDPGNTKRTKDSFTYTATDSSGNCSEPAKVMININKQTGNVEYTDMKGDSAEFAAVYLSEQGIYTGKCVGGEYFFCPEEAVSQGEFLYMCLKASSHALLSDVTKSGLVNDSELPAWVKNSVSTAVLCGCFTGEHTFEYDDSITYEDAVIMVDAVFNITDVATVASIAPYYRNTSAQAMNNLYFCGIVDSSVISKYDEPLNMRDAAIMIAAAREVIEKR